MSMSTHVVGFKPPDDKWKRMKAAWEACTAACIDIPKEVLNFFGHADPDEAGVEVRLEGSACCKLFNHDSVEGFEIDVSKLPKDVKIVRFYNSF